MTTNRNGITLLECVVVIAIIGVLLAILIPATQNVRESSRRVTCQNNLRQISVAIQNHESAHKQLPSLYNGNFITQQPTTGDEFHFHSWRVALLPSLDQAVLYERIDQGRAATDPQNLPNLATSLPVFLCPSTNNPSGNVPEIGVHNPTGLRTVFIGPAARSDYEAVTGL